MTATTSTGLLLRTCDAQMRSNYSGFQWPRPDEDLGHGPGIAVAPDWEPHNDCGNGLHGLLDGQGDASLLNWAEGAIWMVVRPVGDELVNLGAKVKVRSAEVLYAGDRDGALQVLRDAGVTGALPGDRVTAGHSGTATAGNYGTATAGDYGTATAGNYGTATAGDYGTATAGDYGTATAGDYGTATAGNYGCIVIKRWNGKRYRWSLGEIGETLDAAGKPLKPDTKYRLNDEGAFVEVKS